MNKNRKRNKSNRLNKIYTNNNLTNFIFYSLSTIAIGTFFILSLDTENKCRNLKNNQLPDKKEKINKLVMKLHELKMAENNLLHQIPNKISNQYEMSPKIETQTIYWGNIKLKK